MFTDEDSSHYFGVEGGIAIVKLTNGEDLDQPPGAIPVGDQVTWTYRLTNTGNAALTHVGVVDDRGATVTCPQTTLAVGERSTARRPVRQRPARSQTSAR